LAPTTWAFPDEFLWGTAAATHQVEGDNIHNDWWLWEQQPGRVKQGDRSGNACEWWGRRWAEDLGHADSTGQSAQWPSIEWSRVEPEPLTWDDSALGYYRQILQGARRRGLTAMVTLHHFTNPRWLAEPGGWLSDDAAPSARQPRPSVDVCSQIHKKSHLSTNPVEQYAPQVLARLLPTDHTDEIAVGRARGPQ
jgi:hypothetical protein